MDSKTRQMRCKEEHRCPNCFNKHDEDYVYCGKCRKWRSERYSSKKRCKDCGKKLDYGYKFHRCPKCRKGKESPAEYMRTWRKENPDKYQNSTLQRRYGISYVIAQDLYKSQDGKCAICDEEIPPLDSPNKNRYYFAHIDHNHKTNRVRALLCPQCNYLIGNCKEDVSVLEKAIQYLRIHSSL